MGNYPRGSEWRKWDLHIHTPATRLNNQFAEGWEQYLNALSKSETSVFAVTNYFCFANDELEQVRNGLAGLDANKTILGNLEFRISQPNKSGEFINIHVLFSERLATTDINKRISHLELINSADAAGRRVVHCDEEEISVAGLSFENITVDFFALERTLKENFDHSEYLLAACPTGYGSFRPAPGEGRGNGLAIEIDKLCPLMFGNTKDREFYLRNERYAGAFFKPVVAGSDAHKLHDIDGRTCWIKAAPNFEGLRQTLFEPADRISLETAHPNSHFPKPFFSQIKVGGNIIPNQHISFSPQSILLNRSLVALVGGRGTGKSMLLDCLRRCFEEPIIKGKSRYAEMSPETFQIQFTKQGESEVVEFEHNAEGALTYLHVSQGDIREIALDSRKLSEAIKDLLGIKEPGSTVELDTGIARTLEERNDILRWFAETDESGNRVNSGEFNERVIKANEERVKTLTSPENKGLVESYNKNQQEIGLARALKQRLENIRIKLRDFEQEQNPQIATLNLSLAIHKKQIPSLDFTAQTEAINEAVKQLDAVSQNLSQQGIDILGQLKEKGIEQDPKGLLDKVASFQQEIASANERLRRFKDSRGRNDVLRNDLKKSAEQLLEHLTRGAQSIDQSFARLKVGQEGWEQNQISLINRLLDGVEIKGYVDFNVEAFYSGLENVLNLRKFREVGGISRQERFIEKFSVRSFDDFRKLILGQPIITDEEKNLINLLEFSAQKTYFVPHDEYDFLEYIFRPSNQRKYLQVIASIRYRGKTPDRLSVGQRGTFFVCIKLATDPFGSPFVFDQPEDDLDNEFIVDQLVPLFREIKRYRQVIIATHNANLVLNADAEQIIVATNDSELLSYSSGGIEDADIRNSICKVLEGGEEAFMKRESKYSFSQK